MRFLGYLVLAFALFSIAKCTNNSFVYEEKRKQAEADCVSHNGIVLTTENYMHYYCVEKGHYKDITVR